MDLNLEIWCQHYPQVRIIVALRKHRRLRLSPCWHFSIHWNYYIDLYQLFKYIT